MESELLRSLTAQGVVGIILALLVVALWRMGTFIAREIALPLAKSAAEINVKTIQHMDAQERINRSIQEAVTKMSENLIEIRKEHREAAEELIVTIDKLEDKIDKKGPR